jgi:hypothetical protein
MNAILKKMSLPRKGHVTVSGPTYNLQLDTQCLFQIALYSKSLAFSSSLWYIVRKKIGVEKWECG